MDSQSVPSPKLTESELQNTVFEKKALSFSNEKYLRDHPELDEMIHDFLVGVLEAKPHDLVDFAVQYFAKPAPHDDKGKTQ